MQLFSVSKAFTEDKQNLIKKACNAIKKIQVPQSDDSYESQED